MTRPHTTAKQVVITGVTRGLGRAMVDEFARLGNTVLACGRTRDAVAQIRTRFGAPHDFSVVDGRSDGEVEESVTRLLNTHGPPERCSNNAPVIIWNHALCK